jgi:hypothetical protein
MHSFQWVNMGRYATFSTGLEYKFLFAIQESSDINLFGGLERNRRMNDAIIQWNALDRESALKTISQWLDSDALTIRDWIQTFENTVQGSYTILSQKEEMPGWPSDCAMQARVTLGVLIYHQLGYQPDLHCS